MNEQRIEKVESVSKFADSPLAKQAEGKEFQPDKSYYERSLVNGSEETHDEYMPQKIEIPEFPEYLRQGGAYKVVKKYVTEDQEVHHVPAASTNGLEFRDGPSIAMEKADHRLTKSWGNSNDAQDYRKKQNEYVERGEFTSAVQMDIDDIRSRFGDKYDDAISEMNEYWETFGMIRFADKLIEEGKKSNE
ncbi:MAG: hypothetical protein LBN02_04795 [Oscillospiraceae bacterium]|nr:hypothetical protein [Oscillospiraceae bacterium]